MSPPLVVSTYSNMKRTHRKLYMTGLACLFIAWGLLSWLAWSDAAISTIKSAPAGVRVVLLPILVLSWPAHELCLQLSGLGFGYNARCPANVGSFLVFFVQAFLSWILLFIPIWKQTKILPWMSLQLALLLVLLCGFWYWGNG